VIEAARTPWHRRPRTVAIGLAALGAVVVVRFWTAAVPEHASGSMRQVSVAGRPCDDVAYLPDGRIVCAQPLGDAAEAPVALFTALADGKQPHRITFGAARDRAPALLPDGRVVFRRQLGADPGKLFVVNPDGTGVQLFSEPAAGASIEGGPWLADDRLVFAERPRSSSDERLVSVSVRQPFGPREVLAGSQPPADHPASRARPLSLTSVVDERKSTGTLLCLDVRTSRLPEVVARQPATLRVLTSDGHLLGEAPVEADGSFFVEVPADQPLYLELEGPDGIVAADHSGLWVRPNENRGCIGCHEDPELAPENRVVLAIGHGPLPVKAGVQVTQSEGRPQ
jgi:hypothetical protein